MSFPRARAMKRGLRGTVPTCRLSSSSLNGTRQKLLMKWETGVKNGRSPQGWRRR